MLQRLKPECPRARTPQQEKLWQREARAAQLQNSPHSPQLEKAHRQQQRPSTVKNKYKNNFGIKPFGIIPFLKLQLYPVRSVFCLTPHHLAYLPLNVLNAYFINKYILIYSIIEKGEEQCGHLIEAHKECMRALGFKI